MPTKLNQELITAAIDGFQEQKKRIESQIAELRQMLSGGPPAMALIRHYPPRNGGECQPRREPG